MKTETKILEQSTSNSNSKISLPEGVIGFPQLNEMEIVYQEEELPFMWLCDAGDTDLSFLVVDPSKVLLEYAPELSNLDVEFLGVESSQEILLLNIATVHQGDNSFVTLNLVGPIAVNRKTGKAKQIVISNFEKYSAHFPLVAAEDRNDVALSGEYKYASSFA